MDEHSLLVLLTVFIGLATLAMLIQAAMLIGMLVVALQLRSKILENLPLVQRLLGTSNRIVDSLEGHVDKIGATTGSILETTKEQLGKVNALIDNASDRAKVQMDRAEMVLDDTMTRVQTTASFIQSGVLRPVREVHAVFSGVRTALMHLSQPRRSVDHATSDEEMFI